MEKTPHACEVCVFGGAAENRTPVQTSSPSAIVQAFAGDLVFGHLRLAAAWMSFRFLDLDRQAMRFPYPIQPVLGALSASTGKLAVRRRQLI